MKFHVPELITGLIGIAFIGWALLASLKHRRQEALKATNDPDLKVRQLD